MVNFYSVLYNRFVNFQADPAESVRFLYPVSTPRPFIKIKPDIYDCIVGVPSIKIDAIEKEGEQNPDADSNNNSVSYGPFAFVDNSLGRLLTTRMIFASSSLLGAKSVLGWIYFDSMKDWIRTKTDSQRALYTINVIMDGLASKMVGHIEGESYYRETIEQANLVSGNLLSHLSDDIPSAIQTSVATLALSGGNTQNNASYLIPKSISELANNFTGIANSFPSSISSIIDEYSKDIAKTDPKKIKEKLGSQWKAIGGYADSVYHIVEKIPDRWSWSVVSNPYSAPLTLDSSFGSESAASFDVENNADNRGIIIDPKRVFLNSSSNQNSENEHEELFNQMLTERQKETKLLKKISMLSRALKFESVGFPIGDYSSYYRTYSQFSSQIRRMIERIRSVKNVMDEKQFEETGFIDLQVAIQSLASQSPRNDMFMKDENLLKDESWTILIDSSSSLSGVNDTVRAVSICLAEVAKEILGHGNWGMFAFSDDFQCLKDFSERYDNRIRSRIGGLSQRGLSYIPDAIKMSQNLTPGQSNERSYLILVSDGIPSGYRGIEDKFKSSIRELQKRGLTVAAIGIGSNALKRIIQKARVIQDPSEVMKEFVDMYYELSY